MEDSLTKEKFWFKRKKYGYGWYPYSKEGWFITILYILIVIFSSYKLDSQETVIETIAVFIITTFLFILISYKKGEKPKWQFGNKKD